MILVGLEDCPTCKVAHKFLPDVKYIVLKKGKSDGPSSQEVIDTKRALGKKNTSGKFPVIFNDDYSLMVSTDDLLDNLNKQSLKNKFGID